MFDRTDYPYSETLVREAIQNSLDAQLEKDQPVQINFTFYEEAIGSRREYFEKLMEYRDSLGLVIPEEWDNDKIKWLIVEDFNTTGLLGSLEDRKDSDFWNYWLNFGISSKDGTKRGSKGIGRVTFLIASRIQTVIGITSRFKAEKAICGMAVLGVDTNNEFLKSTHAHFAKDINGNIFELHDSDEHYSSIKNSFCFEDYEDGFESGLGLLIPYPHTELSTEVILAAAIENFAPAVLSNNLEIKVDGRVLNKDNIFSIAPTVSDHLNDKAIKNDVVRFLNYINDVLNDDSTTELKFYSIKKNSIKDYPKKNVISKLQNLISFGGSIKLKLSFPIYKNGIKDFVSLKVLIGPSSQTSPTPIDKFFREGMSIPNVKTKTPGDLDLIILAEEGELARYLNLCEGKAHLDFLESQEVKLALKKHGYDQGITLRRYIKNIQTELRILMTPDVPKEDPTVFDKYFSKAKKKRPGRGTITGINTPIDIPPRKVSPVQVSELHNGLKISAEKKFTEWPVNFETIITYSDGTRSPSWNIHDFSFDKLNLNYQQCELSYVDNKVLVKGFSSETIISITGFDPNRELDIKIINQNA